MKHTLLLIFLLFGTLTTQAQRMGEAKDTDDNLLRAALRGWHVRVGAGVDIGGSSPLPIPAEIRKIESFNPTLNLHLEGAAHKTFDRHWGLMLGVRFERKGMETDASVKNYHMKVKSDDGEIEGVWTGRVKTDVANNYFTFPILMTYTFNDRWQIQAGPYLSWMFKGKFSGEAYDGYIRENNPTGTRIDINEGTSASYDYSDDLRHFHWGIQAGGEFKAYKHLSISVNLNWGLNGIFPRDFETVTFALYPIYGTLGFNYLF